jgi:hypothetical protein
MKTETQRKKTTKGALVRQGRDALVDQWGGTSFMMAITTLIKILQRPVGVEAQQQVAEQEAGAVIVVGEEEEVQLLLRRLLYQRQAMSVTKFQKHLLSHPQNEAGGGEEGGDELEVKPLQLLWRIRIRIPAHQRRHPLQLQQRWTLM